MTGCRGCQWARVGDGSGSFSRPGHHQDSSVGHSGRMWCFPGWPAQTGSTTLPLSTSSWTEGRNERTEGEQKPFNMEQTMFYSATTYFPPERYDCRGSIHIVSAFYSLPFSPAQFTATLHFASFTLTYMFHLVQILTCTTCNAFTTFCLHCCYYYYFTCETSLSDLFSTIPVILNLPNFLLVLHVNHCVPMDTDLV